MCLMSRLEINNVLLLFLQGLILLCAHCVLHTFSMLGITSGFRPRNLGALVIVQLHLHESTADSTAARFYLFSSSFRY